MVGACLVRVESGRYGANCSIEIILTRAPASTSNAAFPAPIASRTDDEDWLAGQLHGQGKHAHESAAVSIKMSRNESAAQGPTTMMAGESTSSELSSASVARVSR